MVETDELCKITFPMVLAQIVGQIVINKILNNKQSRINLTKKSNQKQFVV